MSKLLVLMALALPIAFRPDSARANEPSPQEVMSGSSSNDARRELDTVTIEARRKQELKRQISHFVSSAVVTYLNESLERWDTPICPLVAGLPGDRGEFILTRVSQVARDSHAPLGAEHCRPNFYVVLTADPDLLIRKWSKRDRSLLSTCNGMGYARDFLRSRGPVRVYYNATFRSSDGAELSSDASALTLANATLNFTLPACAVAGGRVDTQISYGVVQALTSVIIVVDSKRTTSINIGQLADYVAMVGFAQIRLDADTGTAPTILRLFREPDQSPQGLSPWDQAFLHSLYATDQNSVLQVSAIKAGMLEQIGH